MVEQTPALSQCPLCGADGVTRIGILLHLRQERSSSERDLQLWYQDELKLKNELKTIQNDTDAVQAQIQLAETILLAYDSAQQMFPEYDSLEPLDTIHAILSQKEGLELQYLENRTARTTLAKELNEQCQLLLDGEELNDILNAERRARNILRKNNYPVEDALSAAELRAKIKDIQQHLSDQEKDFQDRLDSLLHSLQKISTEAIAEQQKDLHKRLIELEQEQKHLSKLERFWDRVSEWTAQAPAMNGSALNAHCAYIQNYINQIIQYEEYLKEKREAEQKLEHLTKLIDPYRILNDKLDSLRSPEEYAQEFIQQNIKQISQIFLHLHSPRDFSGLTLNQAGELVCLRNQEQVSTVNMSTGQ